MLHNFSGDCAVFLAFGEPLFAAPVIRIFAIQRSNLEKLDQELAQTVCQSAAERLRWVLLAANNKPRDLKRLIRVIIVDPGIYDAGLCDDLVILLLVLLPVLGEFCLPV